MCFLLGPFPHWFANEDSFQRHPLWGKDFLLLLFLLFFFFLIVKNKLRFSLFRPLADVHLPCIALKPRAAALFTVSTSGNRSCVLCPGNHENKTQSWSFPVYVYFYFELLCCWLKSNNFTDLIWVHMVCKLVATDTRFRCQLALSETNDLKIFFLLGVVNTEK